MISQRRFRNRNAQYGRPGRALQSIPLSPDTKVLNNTLKQLIKVTQDKFVPSKPDVTKRQTPVRDRIYPIERSFTLANLTATNADTTGAYSFTLDSLPGYTELTALFDQYRIRQVRIQFCPLAQQFGSSTTASNYPTIYTLIDYDDASAPANISDMLQYDTLMICPSNEPFERVLNPHATLAAYSGAFTSYAQAPTTQWFDCNSPSIQYYGLKWGVSSVTVVSGTYQMYSVTATVSLEFRHPR
jgi:hypothetical protein